MATEDNRKRSFGIDGSDDDNEYVDQVDPISSTKRTTTGAAGDATSGMQAHLLKMLCPRDIVGNIIGRGGSIISTMNQTSGARIKISQNGEFFPQTTDRVVAISGPKPTIALALTEIITRMIESPESKPSGQSDVFGNPLPSPGNQHSGGSGTNNMVVKLLIPTGASGIVIGKHGAAIKNMSDVSGCHMQLGDSKDPFNTNERVLTITGKSGGLNGLIHGAHLAMAQLFSGESNNVMYSNSRTSYNSVMGPSGSQLGMGHPHRGMGVLPVVPSAGAGLYQPGHMPGYDPSGLSGLVSVYFPGAVGGGDSGASKSQSHQQAQRSQYGQVHTFNPTYNQYESEDARAGGAAYDPAEYVVLNGPVYAGGSSSGTAGAGTGASRGAGALGAGYSSYGSGGNGSSVPSNSSNIGSSSNSSGVGGYRTLVSASGTGNGTPDFTPPVFSTSDGSTVTMQMGVPDHLLGSIIGKGGSIVREIMAITNTTIQVSQKDEYLANTNKHRAVNVKGSQSQVQVALQIIMAKLLST